MPVLSGASIVQYFIITSICIKIDLLLQLLLASYIKFYRNTSNGFSVETFGLRNVLSASCSECDDFHRGKA